MYFLLTALFMAFPVLWVVVVHALGRYAFVRLAKLPIERARLRVFVRLAGPGRTAGRLGALAAGSAASYLGAVAVAVALACCLGVPTGASALVVMDVLPGFDAAGKLQPGDRLIAVDGEPILTGGTPSLAQHVTAKQGAAVTLTVRREGEVLDVIIQPRLAERPDGGRTWLLGLRSTRRPEVTTGAAEVTAFAMSAPIEQARAIITGYLTSISGAFGSDESALDPGGPVRLVDEFRREGQIGTVAWTLALYTATCALLVLVVFDLARAASLAFERRNPT